MPITQVLRTLNNATNGGNVTLALTGAQENDIVLVFGGHPFRSGSVAAGISTAGYTTLFSADTTPNVSFVVAWKRMGASPDANVVGLGSGNASDATAYGAYILRGVDTTTAIDTATQNAVGVDAPSITTVTDLAWVVVCTGTAVVDSTPGTITNYTNIGNTAGNDTVDITIACATREIATAGAENPGAWSSLTSTNARSVTVALRPAAGQEESVNQTDDSGLVDTAAKTQSKGSVNDVGLTDEAAVTKARLQAEQDSENLTDQIALEYEKGFVDFLTNTNQVAVTQQKVREDNTGLTDSVTTTKARFFSLENLVGLADSVFFTIKKVFTHNAGPSDSVALDTGGEELILAGSLVDQKRLIIGSVLGITEPTLSTLSINDLLHRYWGGDFPALHTYDGSESGLALLDFTIMDHFSRVEANEGADLNWIRDVIQ